MARNPDQSRLCRAALAEATGLSEIQTGVQAKIAAAMGLLAPISYRLTGFGRLVNYHQLRRYSASLPGRTPLAGVLLGAATERTSRKGATGDSCHSGEHLP